MERKCELSEENQVKIFNELIENKDAYDKLIDKRIHDLANGIDNHEEFFKEEKKIELNGIRLRRLLGIKTTGEAMYCPRCKKFFSPLPGNQIDFNFCYEHEGKEPFNV